MQANPIQLWRNGSIVEKVGAVTIKRFDTNPEPGVEVTVNELAFSLTGADITARLRFTLILRGNVNTTNTNRLLTSRDNRLRVGDVLIVGSERMLVTLIDDASSSEYYSIKVVRAQDGTAATTHKSGANITVMIVERAATIVAVQDNLCYLPLEAQDLDRSGKFELEFSIVEGTGGRYSIPETPVAINVVDDFEGS